MSVNTQNLLSIALKISDNILIVTNRFTHSKSICDKLCNKIVSSQKFIQDLKIKYDTNKEYFEQPNYNTGFSNYVSVLDNCLNFLEAIEKKALFVRLVNGDKYKKSFYRLFIDIDQAVSVLNLGLSVKKLINQPNASEALDSSQKELALIATRKNGLDEIITEAHQKDIIMEGIRTVQQDILSNEDILASVEISQRHVKAIPGLLPRLGRRYTVYKRIYNGKVVAEKTLKENLGDENFLSNMRKQVAILKQLAVCPFIIQFIGVCVKGNKLGLITAYAEKGNLKDFLESTHRIDKDLKYRFTLDVVEGLAFLHEMGVLHKNIKTSSILITEDYKARISGFEFSREVTSGTTAIFDDGSDRYRWIPPEKIQDLIGSSVQSDVYSLGMVVWSIWSRRYPYEIMSRQAIEDLVSRGGREEISLVPFEIRPIVISCWQHDAMKRPEAADIIDILDSITNTTYEREIAPDSIHDVWSEHNFQTFENYAPEKSIDFKNIKLESSSIHDNFSSPVYNKHNFKERSASISSRGSLISSRSGSTNSFEGVPAPSAPMMDLVDALPCSQLSTKSKYQFSLHNVFPSSSKRSVAESRLNQYERKKFDPNILLPRKEFRETLLGQFDKRQGDGLDLVDPEYDITLDDALDHHNAGRRQLSFKAFLILTKKGEPKAHYYLGYYYFWGQDDVVEKNWLKAISHFHKAAEANDSDALDHLGIYYASEENQEKNLVKAVEYYKRAAALGNKKGYYHLGVCYAKGRGTPVNKELALLNIKEAASRGHTLAIEQVNRARSR